MKPYARLLANHLGNDGVVEDVAKAWGVPRWVIDDGLRERASAPSYRYLPKVAQGLSMTVEDFVAAVSPEESRTEATPA